MDSSSLGPELLDGMFFLFAIVGTAGAIFGAGIVGIMWWIA